MLHVRLGITSDVGSNRMMDDLVLDASRVDEGGIGPADEERKVEVEGSLVLRSRSTIGIRARIPIREGDESRGPALRGGERRR
jgi:hypothetical protein